jgi:hypothetical protein
LQNVEHLCFTGFTAYCTQENITTANGVNQDVDANHGRGGTPNELTAVVSKAFNAASYLTDGFDLEASLSVRSAGL